MDKFIKSSFYSHFLTCRYKKEYDLDYLRTYWEASNYFFKSFFELKDIDIKEREKIEKKIIGRVLSNKERETDEFICTWDIVKSFIKLTAEDIKESKKPKKFYLLDKKDRNRFLIYYYLLSAGIDGKNTLQYLKWTLDKDLFWDDDLPEMFLKMSPEKLKNYLLRKGININQQGEINVKSM